MNALYGNQKSKWDKYVKYVIRIKESIKLNMENIFVQFHATNSYQQKFDQSCILLMQTILANNVKIG